MNARTHDVILAAARVLASVPEAVEVTEVNGTYTIDAAPQDLGAIMGKQRKHATAIECLAQQLEPAAVIRIAMRNGDARHPGARWDSSVRKDWTTADESRLKSQLDYLLKMLFPKSSMEFVPGVRESTYRIVASYVPIDVVGALHILFRAWGRRNGRYVNVTCPTDESRPT